MKHLNIAMVSQTRHDEHELSRMNDEGCPNDPVLSASKMTGIEGTCDTLGQILDRPESLGVGAEVPQPLLDLIGVIRSRLAMEIEKKSKLADEGDLISSIVA
jgi:hypothetical protein